MKKITYKDFPKDVREFIESYFPLEKVSSHKLLHLSLDNIPKEYPEFIKAEFVPPYKISYYGKEREIRWDGVIHDTAHFFQYHTNKEEFEKNRKESKVILEGKFSFYKENKLEKEAFRAQEQYLEFMRQKLGWKETLSWQFTGMDLISMIERFQVWSIDRDINRDINRGIPKYYFMCLHSPDMYADYFRFKGYLETSIPELINCYINKERQGIISLSTLDNNFQFEGNIEDLIKKYEKTLKKKSNIDPKKTFRIYNMESGKLIKELTFEELNKKYKIHPSELERALYNNTAIKGLYVLDPEKEERKRLRIPNRLERESESRGRKIIGINPETGTEYEFSSVREAERELGISRISIIHVLKGRQERAGGWKWRYKDEKKEEKEIDKTKWVGREFILNGSIYLNVEDIEEKGEEIYIVMKDKNTGKLFNYTPQSLADSLQNNKLIENTSQKLSWKKIEGEDLIGRTFQNLEGYKYDIIGIDLEGTLIVIPDYKIGNNFYSIERVKGFIEKGIWKDISTKESISYNEERVRNHLEKGKSLGDISILSWKEIPEDLIGWLVKDSEWMYGVVINYLPYSGYYEARWENTEERAIRLYNERMRADYFQIPILRNRGTVTPIRQVYPLIKTSSDQGFDLYKNQNKEMYQKRLEFYDENKGPEIFWSSKDAQEKRFEALLDIGDLTGREILDVGCGYGDLLTYIENKGINIERYVGVDIVPEIVKKGRKLHEGVNITVRDIQKEPLEENSFDYVMGSGIFALDNNEWEKYVVDMLKEMLRVSKIGVGVNFLKQRPLNRLSWKEIPEDLTGWLVTYLDKERRRNYGVIGKTVGNYYVIHSGYSETAALANTWYPGELIHKSDIINILRYSGDNKNIKFNSSSSKEDQFQQKLSSQTSLTSLKYNDPKQVVDLIKKYVTGKVILKDNYLNDDFTLFLYKN